MAQIQERTGVDDVAGAVQVVQRGQRLAREVLNHRQGDAAEVVLPAQGRQMMMQCKLSASAKQNSLAASHRRSHDQCTMHAQQAAVARS